MSKLTYRDRIGLYPVLVLYLGLGIEFLARKGELGSIFFILLGIVGSYLPFAITLPANWRAALSARMKSRLPLMGAVAPVPATLIVAYESANLQLAPRTGYVLASAAFAVLLTFSIFIGPDKFAAPSRWSWFAFATGFSTGIITVLIEFDVIIALVAAGLYGLYGFVGHVLVRSVIDNDTP